MKFIDELIEITINYMEESFLIMFDERSEDYEEDI